MKHGAIFILFGLIPLVASCASQPVRLTAVGPSPSGGGSTSVGDGRLQAFTETREYADDDVYYFPHSGYQIFTPDGKRFRYVWNHNTQQDEDPTLVTLPAGHYLLRADAEFCGRVLVPVVIKPDQTTRVVLEPGWKPNRRVSPADLVQTPNGYFVGWRADLSRNSQD